MVGKNSAPEDGNVSDNQRIPENYDALYASNNKSTKKRKVEYSDPQTSKKKYVFKCFMYIL